MTDTEFWIIRSVETYVTSQGTPDLPHFYTQVHTVNHFEPPKDTASGGTAPYRTVTWRYQQQETGETYAQECYAVFVTPSKIISEGARFECNFRSP